MGIEVQGLMGTVGRQIMMLKRMREMTDDHNLTIQRLALAALVAVYKDIIPGYRIRPLTEGEQRIKVSKEVKKLRGFEQGLVSGYQLYVEKLGRLVKCRFLLVDGEGGGVCGADKVRQLRERMLRRPP